MPTTELTPYCTGESRKNVFNQNNLYHFEVYHLLGETDSKQGPHCGVSYNRGIWGTQKVHAAEEHQGRLQRRGEL